MQFRLSTLFLVFFMVAASLALFCQSEYYGFWLIALWLDVVIFFAAICINRSVRLKSGVIQVAAIFFIGLICTGLLLPLYEHASPALCRVVCMNNLKQIGLALHNYQDVNKHFPTINTCDKDGKPLFSWRVEILPMMEHSNLYDSLKKDEPWNSPFNANLLSQSRLPEYICLSSYDHRNEKDFSTNYIAIIGPGTAWREDGLVKLSDLPDGGSHTVMLVEVANSGVHWAEPRDLTVDEALEGLQTGKGLRISAAHPFSINVLFADGTVHSLPAKMPISLWRKLLAGEITDFDNIEDKIDKFAPDMVNVSIYTESEAWPFILSLVVWLFSVVLLFRRAVKSRRKSVIETQS